MCRFIAYKGDRILLSDLVTNHSNSLINQSAHARERSEPLNGDGFGLGWYVPEVSAEPCFFTSVTPAWANQNLRRIASKTASPCIFAHVRAATAGLEVNDLNSAIRFSSDSTSGCITASSAIFSILSERCART